MTTAKQLNTEELESGLDHIFESPKDEGVLELIVRRPDVDQREVVAEGRLDVEVGLVGDNWLAGFESGEPSARNTTYDRRRRCRSH